MGGPTPESLAASGSEQAHQTALFAWASLTTYQYPELNWMFAIPNGGTRNRVEAGFMKAAGVRSGVPDVCLPVARWGKHGLFIELKIGKNKPTANQQDWIRALSAMGYAAVVCYHWQTAREYIVQYLEGDPDEHKTLHDADSERYPVSS
jgi:hypothetical protein